MSLIKESMLQFGNEEKTEGGKTIMARRLHNNTFDRFSIWLIFFVVGGGPWGQANESDFLSGFQQKDRLLLCSASPEAPSTASGFVSSFSMTKPSCFFDSAQGMETKKCEIAWTTDWCILKTISTYEHDPIFKAIGTANYKDIDYDLDGNLIITRSVTKYAISTRDRNDSLEELVTYKISPSGVIVSKDSYFALWHFPVGNKKTVYVFDQFKLATGWGFSEHLAEVIEPPGVSSEGLHILEVRGTFGPSLGGKWAIIYEDAGDPIVRRAQFFAGGTDRPAIEIQSSGTVEQSDLKIAQSGIFKAETYEAQFEVSSLRRLAAIDLATLPLWKEVVEAFNTPLPPNSEEVDFRGPKPKRVHP